LRVEIYSKEDCGYCAAAVNLLRQKNIQFEEQKLNIHFCLRSSPALRRLQS